MINDRKYEQDYINSKLSTDSNQNFDEDENTQ